MTLPNSIISSPDSTGGGLGPLETTYTHQIVSPSVAGLARYFIPVGDYFLNAPGEASLEVNMGAGFVPAVLGVDYVYFSRSAISSPGAITVLDAAFGWVWINGAVPAGWTFRFTWLQRLILKTPLSLAKVRLTGVGGTIDLGVSWQMNGPTPPNGVTVPELSDFSTTPPKLYQVEFWRRLEKTGGLSPYITQHRGPRYIPYYRGPVGRFNLHETEFSSGGSGSRSRKFRVCYYRAGFRSGLSPELIVVCDANGHKDRSGLAPVGPSFPTRGQNSVWIAGG